MRFRSGLWRGAFGTVLLLAALASAGALAQALLHGSAQGADDAVARRMELRKLELEVAALERAAAVPTWLSAGGGLVVGLVLGLVSAGTTWRQANRGRIAAEELAHRERMAALDQSVHDRRIEVYTGLVAATDVLALQFPPIAMLSPGICAGMGNALRAWYFEQGGLLMTQASRDAYFALGRALTRAAQAERLAVPRFPADAALISVEAIDAYRKSLGSKLDDIEHWQFGRSADAAGVDLRADAGNPAAAAERFRDYVFLQRLSSRLRTALTEDMGGRRAPEAEAA